MEKIICVICGFEFESDNEDEMVEGICPECSKDEEDFDISYSDCDLF